MALSYAEREVKPEVANTTKAAKRAWESAPAEKQALWVQQREACPETARIAQIADFVSNPLSTLRVPQPRDITTPRSGGVRSRELANGL
jgi:hypothetical protein